MRAKACTTCRQWKARCDATVGSPEGCSRCRSLKLTCVFDASFKRTSKNKCLQQMSSEIQQLRQALIESNKNTSSSSPSIATPQLCMTEDSPNSFSAGWQPGISAASGSIPVADQPTASGAVDLRQASPMSTRASPQGILQLQPPSLDPAQSDASSNQIAPNGPGEGAFGTDWPRQLFVATNEAPGLPASSNSSLPQPSPIGRRAPSSTPYRILGDVGLTRGQVDDQFRTYFAHYHHYLPFKMESSSPEEIYARSPLLFWVIITIASTRKLRGRLAPMIKAMVGETMYVRRHSIESVQALLLLCLWPFPTLSMNEDPSHIYSGIATQIALQLGLHCHSQAHSHLTIFQNQMKPDDEIKMTAWMACFLVNQMQSNMLGVPPTIMVDNNIINHFGHPALDPTLAKMCRIFHLLTQCTLTISGYGPASPSSPPGDTNSRFKMIMAYGAEFASLQATHLDPMDENTKILFLFARVQLWSFALIDDVPLALSPSPSPSSYLDIIKYAERDACDLIELCYGLNLSITPVYIRRAMSYCAFVLARILRSQHASQCEVLEDNIEKVRQALITTSDARGDIIHKACELLQDIPYMEDKRLSPPITSRMGASVLYDLLRIASENKLGSQLGQRTLAFDLDGFDWNILGM
ncbi:suppressor protein sef1 [Orbilia brochopaga]|uniref:Suppressor protein sef1 n=1 Tax=Orbilia brochopaga TaxID=3140254 RepID=A0AAV9U1F9_9PEZI